MPTGRLPATFFQHRLCSVLLVYMPIEGASLQSLVDSACCCGRLSLLSGLSLSSPPTELNRNRLQAADFEVFLKVLRGRCEILPLDEAEDYRQFHAETGQHPRMTVLRSAHSHRLLPLCFCSSNSSLIILMCAITVFGRASIFMHI